MDIWGVMMVVAGFGGVALWLHRTNARHLAAMTEEDRRESERTIQHEIGIW